MIKINFKIIITSLAVIFTTPSLVCSYVYSVDAFCTHAMEKAAEKVNLVTEIESNYIDIYIDDHLKALNNIFDYDFLVKLLEMDHDNPKREDLYIQAQEVVDKYTEGFSGILNSSGVPIIARDRSFIGLDYSSVINQYIAGREVGYAIYPAPNSEELYLGAAFPVLNEKKEELGYFFLRSSLFDLNKAIADLDSSLGGATTYLVNNQMILLTPSRYLKGDNKGVLTQVVDTVNIKNCFDKKLDDFEINRSECFNNYCTFLDFRGELVIGVSKYVDNVDWCYVVEVDYDKIILDPVIKYKRHRICSLIFAALIIIPLSFVAGVLLDRRVVIRKRKK